MQPWETIATDGDLVLARRGDEWAVRSGGRVLMTSRTHGSEEALAAIALGRAARAETVLVGGLGLGFTVRAVLDRVAADARVVVAELSRALVAWNRGPVADLAGRPLEDPRVRLQVGDVLDRVAEARRAFDAVLLDVDNGPAALASAANDRLYGARGLAAAYEALRPGGALAVWSAGHDEGFLGRLRRVGFDAAAEAVRARGARGGVRHVVFVAVRPAGRGAPPRSR